MLNAIFGWGTPSPNTSNTTAETSPSTQYSESMTEERARKVFDGVVTDTFDENLSLKNRVAELERELQATQRQLATRTEQFKKENGALSSQNVSLAQELEQERRQSSQFSKLLEAANSDRRELRKENTELKDLRDELKENLKAEREKNENLTYRLEDTKRELVFSTAGLRASLAEIEKELPQGEDGTPGKRNNPKPGAT